MGREKGCVSPMRGKKQSDEHKRKIAEGEFRHKEWSLDNFDDGYVSQGRFRVLARHPRADRHNTRGQGYIFRSIVAYEAYHGVKVGRGDIVHHINGDKLDDSKENLALVSFSKHNIIHKPNYRHGRCVNG